MTGENKVRVEGCIKNNISRMAQNIEQNKVDTVSNNPFRVNDVARARIIVDDTQLIWDIYAKLEKEFTIIKINPGNNENKFITLNFVYDKRIIGEIQIKYSQNHHTYD